MKKQHSCCLIRRQRGGQHKDLPNINSFHLPSLRNGLSLSLSPSLVGIYGIRLCMVEPSKPFTENRFQGFLHRRAQQPRPRVYVFMQIVLRVGRSKVVHLPTVVLPTFRGLSGCSARSDVSEQPLPPFAGISCSSRSGLLPAGHGRSWLAVAFDSIIRYKHTCGLPSSRLH